MRRILNNPLKLNMKEFIAYLIKNIVDDPNAVEIAIEDQENTAIIAVRVSPNDVAKVVGKQGRTIKALRTIAMTLGARFGRRVRLQLLNE
jgi:uncharacterized protein